MAGGRAALASARKSVALKYCERFVLVELTVQKNALTRKDAMAFLKSCPAVSPTGGPGINASVKVNQANLSQFKPLKLFLRCPAAAADRWLEEGEGTIAEHSVATGMLSEKYRARFGELALPGKGTPRVPDSGRGIRVNRRQSCLIVSNRA